MRTRKPMSHVTNRGSVKLNISLPIETKKKLDRIAKKELRPVSNMIAYLIEKYEE